MYEEKNQSNIEIEQTQGLITVYNAQAVMRIRSLHTECFNMILYKQQLLAKPIFLFFKKKKTFIHQY